MEPTFTSRNADQKSSGLDYEASIEACAKGDRAALRRLFEEETGRLIAVARRIVRRRELAEDVVQDAFVQIWRHAGRFDRRLGSGRGWMYTIVRNRALNVIRDSSREHLIDDMGLDTWRDQDLVIDDAFQRLATNSRLRYCLEQLDAKKRRSLLLSYVAGFSHGEIAGKLGVPLGTAKSWVRRAVMALKECLS